MNQDRNVRCRALDAQRSWLAAAALIGSGPTALAIAHDTPTHCRLTQEALRESVRFREVVVELEFDQRSYRPDYLAAAVMASPRIRTLTRDAYGLVMAGSVLEDGQSLFITSLCTLNACPSALGDFSWFRPRNHFQDVTGAPLSGGPHNARDWAFDGAGNEYSWRAAVAHFESSIVGAQELERLEAEEHMLVALGCNVHLLQDQTSPAHTRNDPHPGHELFGVPGTVLGASLIEERETNFISMTRNAFATVGVGAETRLTHASYFDARVLETATHFFSDDTIDASYPFPAAWTLSTSDRCPPNALYTPEEYYRSTDAFHGATNRLARRRLLPGLNAPSVIPARKTLIGSACDTFHGIDSVVVDNLSLLAPAAVSASAGLIDHFFRGRLSLAQDASGALIVTNDSYRPAGLFPDVTLSADTAALVPYELVIVQEMPDGSRQEIRREPLPTLALGDSVSIDGLASDLIASGTDRIYACARGAAIGFDPGCAAGAITWVRCSDLCSDEAQESTAVEDLNSDGGTDMVLHFPFDAAAPAALAGSIRAYSAADCGQLWSRFGTTANQLYGARVVSVGRWNNDESDDLVVQDRFDSNLQLYSMHVLSGATGGLLGSFLWPSALSGELEALDDVNADGVGDIGVANAPYRVVSGKSGSVLRTCSSVVAGAVTSRAEDWNHDGVREVLVERSDGTFFLLNPKNCASLYQSSVVSGDYTDFRGFASIEDFDGDGFADFVGISKLQTGQSPLDARDVGIFSGRFGALVGVLAQAAHELKSAGNFDGSVGGEFCARRLIADTQGQFVAWEQTIWSAVGPTPLRQFQESEFVMSTARVLGDRNGDGATDLYYNVSASAAQQNCVRFVMGSN
ncbi:MAG: hypothetical protein IT454_21010 [Planctomycetes bacterium]|nr:hypothetical protein [Planctomycetota bacterium]